MEVFPSFSAIQGRFIPLRNLSPLSDLDPPDTFLYVTIGLIALSALLFVESTADYVHDLSLCDVEA